MGKGADKSRGFTLIEILMVVVILGIASAVIVPAIGSRDDLKVSAAARVLMADLLYAQSRAITTQKLTYVKFDPGDGSYSLLSSLSPARVLDHPVQGGEFVMRFGASAGSGLRGVTLGGADFDGHSILAFDELGSPMSVHGGTRAVTALGSGRIQLSSGSRTLAVEIEPFTGDITVH